MLVLSRKAQETIHVGNNVKIILLKTKGEKTRIGIEAPADMKILRGELVEEEKAVV